ncbi:MAG: polysaccharide biosynthesis/export family protein [Paludibacter sp.]
MSNKKTNISILILTLVLVLNSCAGVKEIAYLQKLSTKTDSLKQNSGLFEARIKPKDMLSITVTSSEPLTTKMYNLVLPQINENAEKNLTSFPGLQSYLVDNDGIIDFPVFGKIKVNGLSLKELENLLQKKLEPSFSKERPIITIRFTNYTINVLGEVNRPGKYSTANERITILDALSNAGDLTIFGRRDNIKVLREYADGSKKTINMNLNDENVIHSPAYYLEQNDVVYVEPNLTKARSASFGAAESFGISALSIGISLTSLLINILK